MGFMAGFGAGFAQSFNASQEQYNQEKMLVLQQAYEQWNRMSELYQQSKIADDKNKVLAHALVDTAGQGVPAEAWTYAYKWLSAGLSGDDVIKRLQTTQFGTPTTNGISSQLDPSQTGLNATPKPDPLSSTSKFANPNSNTDNGTTTTDTTMPTNASPGGAPQASISPQFQNNSNPMQPTPAQGLNTSTTAPNPSALTAPTDGAQAANPGAQAGTMPAGQPSDTGAPSAAAMAPQTVTTAPSQAPLANNNPVTNPASAPMDLMQQAPTTTINNPNTHPATYQPTANPVPQANNDGTATGNTAVTTGLPDIGATLQLAGRALFDPEARRQLQTQNDQRMFQQANDRIAASSGMTPEQMAQIRQGFIPEMPQDTLPIVGQQRVMDPQSQAALYGQMLPELEKNRQSKVAAVETVKQLNALDNIVRQNPAVLTAMGKTSAFVNAATQQFSSVVGAISATVGNTQSPAAAQDQMNQWIDKNITPGMEKTADAYKLYYSQAIAAAYANAKANSDDGKVSDDDFKNGFNSLISSNNYKDFSTNLRVNAKRVLDKADINSKSLSQFSGVQMFNGTPTGEAIKGDLSPVAQDQSLGGNIGSGSYWANTPASASINMNRWTAPVTGESANGSQTSTGPSTGGIITADMVAKVQQKDPNLAKQLSQNIGKPYVVSNGQLIFGNNSSPPSQSAGATSRSDGWN